MHTRELICSEIWGGNGSGSTELILPGLRGVLVSKACGGRNGGDVYYSSACAAGVISRICLADVAGHGEQVAQVGAWLHGTMRRHMGRHDPARVFRTMNERAGIFGIEALTTAVCLSYNIMTAELRFCYAGHPPVLLRRRDEQAWRPLETADVSDGPRNLPFGVLSDTGFDTGTLVLHEGDRLALYSDGVLETPNADHALFGPEGLYAVLASCGSAPLAEVAARVMQALARHAGTTGLNHDDITFAVVEAGPRALEPKLWHLLRNQSRKLRDRVRTTRP